MKKLLKFLGSVAAIAAAVAGGIAIYEKYFADKSDLDDFDEDFEDEFDDDLDESEAASSERGYVHIDNAKATSDSDEKGDETAEDKPDDTEETAEDEAADEAEKTE